MTTRNLENVLQDINASIVRMDADEQRRNNAILKDVLNKIISSLEEDALFKIMFSDCFYGGSYYDGLKTKGPDEYDLDLLFRLPKIAKPKLEIAKKHPGFVKLKLEDMASLHKQPLAASYKKLDNMLINDYLNVTAVNKWFTGILQKALNKCNVFGNGKYTVTNFTYSGPARTLKISGPNFIVDVDLVPCFVLDNSNWPKSNYRANPTKDEFFIVPKPCSDDTYWRLSFQKQERNIIRNKCHLKPALRLLKTLRDAENNTQIKSYFLKTIILLILEEDVHAFDGKSLASAFMYMLKKYQEYIVMECIPYYWNKSFNLLDGVQSIALYNLHCRLAKIISKIEKDPSILYDLFKVIKDNNDFEFVERPETNDVVLLENEGNQSSGWFKAVVIGTGVLGAISAFKYFNRNKE